MYYSIVLAGGSGTRLWPLSRATEPKFLHALTGTDLSLLQITVQRLGGLSPADRTYVVTGAAHVAAVSRQLPDIPPDNLLVEPAPRDSCAAIGLAAALISRRDPEAVIGVFAADHLVGDQDRFTETVVRAQKVAEAGYLTTVGVRPTAPEVGFGYLRLGAGLPGGANAVAEFKEKPTLHDAIGYLESGDYLWNAGMFVFRAASFLESLAEQKPDLHAGVARFADLWNVPGAEQERIDVWQTLEKISVDYAVMEGAAAAGRVATVPADFPWSDVGDFDSLGDSLACDESDNLVLRQSDRTVLRDVKSTVIVSTTDRVVAAVGVEDLIVVETADAVLVCPRSRAGEVKQIVDALRELGLAAYV